MMLTATALILIASTLGKKQSIDRQKFKMMSIWFSIPVFIILFLIQWNFKEVIAN